MSQPRFETLPDGRVQTAQPISAPDIWDILIVGGGPSGTASALRAKELGLTALVIDRDDLMSRIRDYSKDKLIYPNYGGEDAMRFPKAGDLIARLPFPPIDKDEICAAWKDLYVEFSLPAKVGLELMGVERQGEGWMATAYNHNTKAEETFQAKHVVLAIGRGVPRTFDIPGNMMGIHYRLADPDDFLGQPVCVVGGGTSAAEAVIALSRAKVRSNDPTCVYWSYRGDKMPRVSKALNEEFFEAFVLNGNVRYYPSSEPASVVTAEDHQDYISIRVDRRRLEGRPAETSHLEFLKSLTIACIGEDIPEKFLNAMAIEMASPGAGKKKMIVVNPVLQSQQPSIYLVGDILSQYYLRSDDFGADPASFERVRHPGNIKSALRDGVYIADVIQARLQGRSGREVVVVDGEPDRVESKPFVSPVEAPEEEAVAANVVPVVDEPAYLTRIMPGGVEDARFAIKGHGVTTIGRRDCDINLSDDVLLSERHASITRTPDGFLLRDDASANGVFLMLNPEKPRPVRKGDVLGVGQHFLLFGQGEKKGFFVSHYDQTGKLVERHALAEGSITLVGRQSPHITLDRKDLSLSRRHLKISVQDGVVTVRDLFSANGSALRIRESLLEHGDRFRVGQSVFAFTLRKVSAEVAAQESRAAPVPVPPEPAPDAVEIPADQITVTFQGLDQTLPLANRTILEAAEEGGIDLESSCRAGTCGIDPIRILSGAEYLNACGEDEIKTLAENGKKCPQHRYACMARARGPVVVEIVKG